MKFRFSALLSLLALLPFQGSSEIRMPHIFSDNMVLQADTAALMWGYASPGAKVTVESSWGAQASAVAGKDGRWKTSLSTPVPSYEPLSLKVTDTKDNASVSFSNILAGEVWVASGQSNMEMPLRGFLHQPIEGAGDEITFSSKLGKGIRFINVPRKVYYKPQEDIDAMWQTIRPETVGELSALAWFFARNLQDIIDRPIGIINASYGGSKVEGWVPEEILATYPDRNYAAERDNPSINDWERVGVMYNAMLYPVAGYTARGFLWNQGESNVGGHDYYPSRQNDMVMHWRKIWNNPQMQFYFVELPGWDYGNVDEVDAALFREAQHRAEALTDGSHIVCTSDLVYPDEPDDIHARNKRDIGKRMAASAATFSYGIKGIPHKYPTYKSVELKGDKAELFFNDAWQGFTPNEDLQGFEVAGDDRVFYPAKAEVDRNGVSITVSSDKVNEIKSVRYCFKNFAIGEIHDSYGMPLVPFRTDNWDR